MNQQCPTTVNFIRREYKEDIFCAVFTTSNTDGCGCGYRCSVVDDSCCLCEDLIDVGVAQENIPPSPPRNFTDVDLVSDWVGE